MKVILGVSDVFMKDDPIVWFKGVDPKDFSGFEIIRNGKPDCFDVFGFLKSNDFVRLRIGYMKMLKRDLSGIVGFCQLFMFSFVFVFPLFLRMIWL